jgi:hypothetical protein
MMTIFPGIHPTLSNAADPMKTLTSNADSTTLRSDESANVCRSGTGKHWLTVSLLTAASLLGVASMTTAQTAPPAAQPIIVADFNHDGIPDALIESTNAPTATIVFGSVPYGSFGGNSKGVTFPAGCAAPLSGAVVVGDFNGDGFPDLAFFCGVTSGTMLGNGDGTFGTAVTISSPTGGHAVVGDFDKDGKLDIAVLVTAGVSAPSQAIQFLSGKGDGTFNAAVISNLTVNTYTALVATDLNQDGFADLVLLNAPADGTSSADVFGNNQDGTFGAGTGGVFSASTSASVSAPGATVLLTGNVFGAATSDLIVAVPGASGNLYAFQNTSTATAFSFNDPVLIPVANLTGAQAGKFTGSGFTDVAVSNGTQISALANDGKGNFAANFSKLTLASTSSQFAVADANGDGYSDIYTASLPSGGALQLGVSLTTGSATATSQPFSLTIGTHAISAAWSGNVNFTGITPAGTQIVVGAPSLTTLASSKNPSLVSDAVTFTVHVAPGAGVTSTVVPTGTVILMDGTATLASGVVDGTGTFTYTTTALSQATHTIVANYAGDATYAASTATLSQVVNHAPAVVPNLIWATPAAIVYGTALSNVQLNATAIDATGATIPGVFTYTPAAGAVLEVGPQTLSVTFTPTDLLSFTAATKTVALTVARANPTITWATPASIAYGTALSGAQLNAAAAGVTGTALPGVFVYMPAAGTILSPGTQALAVTFTPTNTRDYNVANASVNLVVGGAAVGSFTPTSASLGAGPTTITVTGTGFASNSLIQVNKTALPTTAAGSTTLTAVIPASYFTTVGTLQITVTDPSIGSTSAPVAFAVTAPPPAAILTGPPTTDPGTQPALDFTLSAPYPVDITATLTLGFAASTSPAIDDPSIQFASGGRTLTFVIPANTVTVPAITLQAGTVAGTITIPITLIAGGSNITPATLVPAVITVPPIAPTITGVTLTRSGNELTAVIHGFSNTREMVNAKFHFTAATGASLSTTDLTIPTDTIFNTNWFLTDTSDQYGSTFTYTQIFNTSDAATDIGTVDVTLTNTVGASSTQTAQ